MDDEDDVSLTPTTNGSCSPETSRNRSQGKSLVRLEMYMVLLCQLMSCSTSKLLQIRGLLLFILESLECFRLLSVSAYPRRARFVYYDIFNPFLSRGMIRCADFPIIMVSNSLLLPQYPREQDRVTCTRTGIFRVYKFKLCIAYINVNSINRPSDIIV